MYVCVCVYVKVDMRIKRSKTGHSTSCCVGLFVCVGKEYVCVYVCVCFVKIDMRIKRSKTGHSTSCCVGLFVLERSMCVYVCVCVVCVCVCM